jgi:acid phosphatase type 7
MVTLMSSCAKLLIMLLLFGSAVGNYFSFSDSANVEHTTLEPLAQWWFVQDTRLSGRAGNDQRRSPQLQEHQVLVEIPSNPLNFKGQLPTERQRNLLDGKQVPREEFSVEMWASYHVNQPVGAIVAVRGQDGEPVPWLLSFHDWEASLRLKFEDQQEVLLKRPLKTWTGYKQRWVHLVANVSSEQVELYVNGDLAASMEQTDRRLAWPSQPEFEIAAYLENEPYMQLGNLIRNVSLWDRRLKKEEISKRFQTLCEQVDRGEVFPGKFHFTAPPYLHLLTSSAVNLLWETDRDASSELRWGPTADLEHSQSFHQAQRLQETTLEGLTPNTTYFYRVTCKSEGIQPLDSGLLTFRTGVNSGDPFRFAIIGDTESRPHVNHRLAEMIWGERPHFLVNLGDLTDAGMEQHRYEWTQEYFLGMGALHSRVPVFPVPGNGEGDLFWYRYYHRLPEPEGYYQFQYGDVGFFMLDSNRSASEFVVGGKQHQWLEKRLTESKAKWKIVCFHHATYTSEEDDYGDRWKEELGTFGDMNVRPIVPLCERLGVDLMMFGHLHLYERSFPIRDGKIDPQQGIVHLLAGGGGGDLEDFGPTPTWFSAKTYRGHHYVMCEVNGDCLTFQMYDLDGRLRDQWQIGQPKAD